MIGVLGFDSRRALRIFLFTTVSRKSLGPAQPGDLSLALKRPGRETDHSPTSSTEVKNMWSYTSTLQYVFMAWCLVKQSSVGIVLGYGLDDRCSRIRFPAGAVNSSLHHRFQNDSGVHPASYPMGTRGSFLGGKAAGA
jgi:hypothetical protein